MTEKPLNAGLDRIVDRPACPKCRSLDVRFAGGESYVGRVGWRKDVSCWNCSWMGTENELAKLTNTSEKR